MQVSVISVLLLQESLEALAKENKELQALVSQLAADLDGRILHRLEGEQLQLVSREEAELGSHLIVHLPPFTGDGVESDMMTEEIQKSSFVIPEKFESHEEVVSLNRKALEFSSKQTPGKGGR